MDFYSGIVLRALGVCSPALLLPRNLFFTGLQALAGVASTGASLLLTFGRMLLLQHNGISCWQVLPAPA